LLTRRGQRISIAPFLAGGPLGGDTQIYGWDVEASQYFHLPKDLIFLLNAEAATVQTWGGDRFTQIRTRFIEPPGATPTPTPGVTPSPTPPNTIQVVPNVPIYDRLYLGGSNNLRGFAYRDVGPRDIHGEPIGGLSMARGTAELTFPIIEKARGAVFYDMGYVDANAWAIGSEHWASDYGIGLRLDLPIGPLRLDYGIPLENDGRGKGGHFNFNVGYQF
jgi:outer membrane protein insertion porin family